MIRPEDAEFHEPSSQSERMWAETNYFGFDVPEVPMHVGLYALFRPNLGVVNSAIFVNSKKVDAAWEIDFWDSRAYLPMPESKSLLNYQLDNGLSITCLDPNRVWRLQFDNGESLRIDVEFRALMEPFDIHDPDMDPRAKKSIDDLSGSAAYTGHFDMTGKVEGELTLNGRTYQVDALSTMDHSWGVREERQLGTMTWLQAHFNEDLAVHSMFSFDPTIGPDQTVVADITHGYIMEKGQGIGLKDGRATIRRSGMYAQAIDLELTDANDREWTLSGVSKTQFPCQFWPGSMAFMVMPEWQMGDLTGYGTSTDFLDLYHYTKLYN